ncbi:MAG: transposase [Actinomycetota bacterium]
MFWVVDNGSSHRGERSILRREDRWPTLCLVHLPVHSSWLNQVEIYFSIVQRKVLTPNDFTDLEDLERRLLSLERRYGGRQAVRVEVHPEGSGSAHAAAG